MAATSQQQQQHGWLTEAHIESLAGDGVAWASMWHDATTAWRSQEQLRKTRVGIEERAAEAKAESLQRADSARVAARRQQLAEGLEAWLATTVSEDDEDEDDGDAPTRPSLPGRRGSVSNNSSSSGFPAPRGGRGGGGGNSSGRLPAPPTTSTGRPLRRLSDPLLAAVNNHSHHSAVGAASTAYASISKASAAATAPPVTPLASPMDLEPVDHLWLLPHATGTAREAAHRHRAGDYQAAVKLWSQLLPQTLCPAGIAVVLGNRAATLIAAGYHEVAVRDCGVALEACPAHSASVMRMARCHLVLGQYPRAKQLLANLPKSKCAYDTAAEIRAADALTSFQLYLDHGNYTAALEAISRVCTTVVGGDAAFELMRLEAISIVAPDTALDEAMALVEARPRLAEAIFLKGIFLFRSDATGATVAAALEALQEAKQMAVAAAVTIPFWKPGMQRPATGAVPSPQEAGGIMWGAKDGKPSAAAAASQQAAPAEQVQSARYTEICNALAALTSLLPVLSALDGAHRGNRHSQLVQACTAAMQIDMLGHRKLRSFVLLRRAQGLMGLSRAAPAVSDCTDGMLVVDSPFLFDLHCVRSDAFAALCDPARALADAKEAYRLNPNTASYDRVERCKEAAQRASRQPTQPQPQQQQQRPGSAPAAGRGTWRPGFKKYFEGGGGGNDGGDVPNRDDMPRTSSGRDTQQQQQQQRQPAGGGGGGQPPRPATHYETLGVPRDSDRKAISKAYRDAALQWHPDKWSDRGSQLQLQAEARFKTIASAYSVLSDAGSRAAYDRALPREAAM